ncbi:MAG: chorismate--pyruvate lyase [Oscillospiraceae bacterium]|nr:chorismate--pyruvate lyase [Oscillospiraceae bacterium]
MEPHDYVVADIRGDYAELRQVDAPDAEPFPVALALLPAETDLGTKLRGFMGMFEVIE